MIISCNDTHSQNSNGVQFHTVCVCAMIRGPHLHPGRGGVSAHQHADLLLVGQQGSHGLLVRGVPQVDGVHLQDAVADSQPALASEAVRDDLLEREAKY